MQTKETGRWTPEQQAQAAAIVLRAGQVQKSRNLSDRKFVAEFPDLGSAKTWRTRLLAGNYQGLNPIRTLERLQRFVVILEGGQPDAVFFRDLPFAKEVSARVQALERTTNDRRILVVLAPNGTGKTSVARWCVHQSAASRVYCRLRPAWRNKELHLANGIAAALGAGETASNAAEAEETLFSLLSGQPRTVFLDQAHEGGPALLHLLRALVDETPSRFVYLGYDTAFRRVQTANTDAMIEAQAFLGRCQKPIFDLYKHGTRPTDVALYLQRAADLPADTAMGVAARIAATLSRHTNLRLLDDAIQSARSASEDDEPAPDVIVSEVFRLAGLEPDKTTQKEEAE